MQQWPADLNDHKWWHRHHLQRARSARRNYCRKIAAQELTAAASRRQMYVKQMTI